MRSVPVVLSGSDQRSGSPSRILNEVAHSEVRVERGWKLLCCCLDGFWLAMFPARSWKVESDNAKKVDRISQGS